MRTVLVIDDNPAVRTALELLFGLHDIRTVGAESPELGLSNQRVACAQGQIAGKRADQAVVGKRRAIAEAARSGAFVLTSEIALLNNRLLPCSLLPPC